MSTHTTTIKKHVLVSARIECTPIPHVTRYCGGSVENMARALQNWANDVMEFIRDHRSMDPLDLEVIRDYQDLCAKCLAPWEPCEDEDTNEIYCASCGATLENKANAHQTIEKPL